MAIAYRGGVSDGGATNPTSGTWSLTGTNAVAGDFAICHWYSRASTKTITPTGPTLITNNDKYTANGGHIWVGYKVITATDITNGNVGTWTANGVTNGTTGCTVVVFSGVDTSVGVRAATTPVAGGVGNPDPPSLSTLADDCLVVLFGQMDQNDGALPPTNFTGAMGWSTTSGSDGSSYIAYDLDGGTGSTVNPAVFTTTTDSYWYATTLALSPEYAPTVALNTPTGAATGQSTTPDLLFTGTDLNADTLEYNIQVDTLNSFNSTIGNIDYASEIKTGDWNLSKIGQSFTGNGNKITGAKFYLKKGGTPTGDITIEIYAHSGSYGTSSLPTGTPLATSDTISITTVNLTYELIEFSFTGAQQYTLIDGTKYVIVINYGGTPSLYAREGLGHGGNLCNSSGVWISYPTSDLLFFVIGESPILSKFSSIPDAGFTAGHPFANGSQITYTVQSALTEGTTYYWRVRAIDPSGSNTWGAWSSILSFTTQAAGYTTKSLKAYIGGIWTTKPLKAYIAGAWTTKNLKFMP